MFLPSIRDRVNLVSRISKKDWGSQYFVEKAAWRHEGLHWYIHHCYLIWRLAMMGNLNINYLTIVFKHKLKFWGRELRIHLQWVLYLALLKWTTLKLIKKINNIPVLHPIFKNCLCAFKIKIEGIILKLIDLQMSWINLWRPWECFRILVIFKQLK